MSKAKKLNLLMSLFLTFGDYSRCEGCPDTHEEPADRKPSRQKSYDAINPVNTFAINPSGPK